MRQRGIWIKFLLHKLIYKRLSSSPSLSESRINSLSQEAQAIKNGSGNKEPTQEKIVLALSSLIERVTLPHRSGKEVLYQIRRCPRGDYCTNGLMDGYPDKGLIKFPDGFGYHPYPHPQHKKFLKHHIYILYGSGMQSEVVYCLNHDLTASFVFNHTLNFPKIYLHLHRY